MNNLGLTPPPPHGPRTPGKCVPLVMSGLKDVVFVGAADRLRKLAALTPRPRPAILPVMKERLD
jgi:hypothetical protein